jgi:hypothetical protein
MPNWRNEYRRCDNCRSEYRPEREAQSYCSRRCRRQAAYGRERFSIGTRGRRRRRLEASDKLPATLTLVAGNFRNGVFSSIETECCKPTNWIEKLNQRDANEIDRAYRTREKREWPVDLMGGARHSARRPTLTVDPKLRQTILDTEQLLKDDEPTSPVLVGDEIQLEYYDDGYPKLPDCLDRRPEPLLAQAA